ncbi:hypothetical protein AABB24_005424 [Solanum stoloniferum]|uniref:Uncharacterized protein n=1 Tax=Solanum stoloniferum TaxID=62892 RepID=A0ABD2UZ13_9SOLN
MIMEHSSHDIRARGLILYVTTTKNQGTPETNATRYMSIHRQTVHKQTIIRIQTPLIIHNGYRGNNQNPRFNKGKGLMDDVHGGGGSGEEGHMGTHADTGPQLTREQYAQFVELLQQFQAEKDNAFTISNVNFAGSFNEEASGDW